MGMPADLILVRHGESEGNIESARARAGDPGAFAGEFQRRHSSLWRLTERGIWQAKVAGHWIRYELGEGIGKREHFDGYFVSEYIRALETAHYLFLPGAEWRLSFKLRERDWGQLDHLSHEDRTLTFTREFERRKIDGFYWAPPGGESMAQMCDRIHDVFDTLHREFDGKRVVIVCHGDVMWGFRVLLERISIDRYLELEKQERIFNGQILHYTRHDPATRRYDRHFVAVRSLCPWDISLSRNEWQPIERKKLSNEDLRAIVERVLRINSGP